MFGRSRQARDIVCQTGETQIDIEDIFFHFLIPSAVFIFSALFFSAVILTTFKCLYSFQHESSSLSYIF